MNNDTHVYPLNDLRGHVTKGVECPCNPTIEVIGKNLLIIHNAFDNREVVEEAIAIMNNEDGDNKICCSNCRGEVMEFSIPNDIWNFVVRKNGRETNNEYLCENCWFTKLRETLGLI